MGPIFFSASACSLNNILEVEHDSLMNRTKDRELPNNKISFVEAWVIIIICFLIGTYFLLSVNIMTFLLAVLTFLTYCFIYTPLKRISWINTLVGAVPGALPIIGGWVATGTPMHIAAISVFFTLFSWQIPHFYALSIMYLDDYTSAGFKMLPIGDENYQSTRRQIIIFTFLMIVSSIGPFLYGFLSEIYLFGVLVLSGAFLVLTIKFIKDFTKKNAKKLFILSIIYLPLWLILVLVDIILK